jgi:hypothetical protein
MSRKLLSEIDYDKDPLTWIDSHHTNKGNTQVTVFVDHRLDITWITRSGRIVTVETIDPPLAPTKDQEQTLEKKKF